MTFTDYFIRSLCAVLSLALVMIFSFTAVNLASTTGQALISVRPSEDYVSDTWEYRDPLDGYRDYDWQPNPNGGWDAIEERDPWAAREELREDDSASVITVADESFVAFLLGALIKPIYYIAFMTFFVMGVWRMLVWFCYRIYHLAKARQQERYRQMVERKLVNAEHPSVYELKQIRERLMVMSRDADTAEALRDISALIDDVDEIISQLKKRDRDYELGNYDRVIKAVSEHELIELPEEQPVEQPQLPAPERDSLADLVGQTRKRAGRFVRQLIN